LFFNQTQLLSQHSHQHDCAKNFTGADAWAGRSGLSGATGASSFLDELKKNYLWTARAKGANERRVLFRHAFPNALIPIITFASIQLVYLLAGSVVVEAIFARQGIGRLAVTAIQNRDFPLVQGVVLTIATMYVLINTITDILYAFIDPRIRLQ
jgi:peptide/nickel transport system permease protein